MKQSQLPKYLQLKQEILSWLKSEQLKPGDQMPSENEIAGKFQMSRQTVRQTFGELEQEGWLYRMQGKGTFVSTPKVNKGLDKNTIGMITTSITDYIFPHIVKGAEAALREQGFSMLLSSTDNNKEKEGESLKTMIGQPLSGLIIEPTKSSQGNPNLNFYLSLENKQIPYLMINARYPEIDCPTITVEDEAGTFLGTEHLIQYGHKRIAGFFKTDDMQGVKRLRGFLRAHQHYKLALMPNAVVQYITEEKKVKPFDIALAMLKLPINERPTAFVCYNDELAVSLLEAIRQAGLSVPADVSVVGFDDSSLATATEVKLTTLSHPKAEMGKKAAEMLLKMIESKNKKVEDVVYTTELIIRESTRKI